MRKGIVWKMLMTALLFIAAVIALLYFPKFSKRQRSLSGTGELSCTISVSCGTVFSNMDKLVPEKKEIIPSDGVICPPVTVSFSEGESVFDVLYRLVRDKKIHMEFSENAVYGSVYIEGIANLYEFDCGELSGWMYCVNGYFPNYGMSLYRLEDGDEAKIMYTCDMGSDIGGGYGAEEER